MEKIKIVDENGIEDNIEAAIGKNHIEDLVFVAKKYGITYDRVNAEEIIKKLADMNKIVFLNYGLIDGKKTYTIALPEILSNEQIKYMKEKKEYLINKCDIHSVFVNTHNKTEYNTIMRNLTIENKIYNLNFINQVDILYNEIDNQKRNSKVKTISF